MVEQTQTPSSTLNFADELDCGSFFDQMDDLLDFPSDEDDETKKYEDVNNSFKPTSSILANHGGSGGGSDDLSSGLYVPDDDIVQLDLLSSVVEDSGFLTMNNKSNLVNKDSFPSAARRLRTSSPISVHDSSGDHQKAATSANVASGKRGRPRRKKVCPCCYTYYIRRNGSKEHRQTTTDNSSDFEIEDDSDFEISNGGESQSRRRSYGKKKMKQNIRRNSAPAGYSNPEEPGNSSEVAPPSFRVTMTKTYIAGSHAYMPVSFLKRYMSKESQLVEVKVGNGKEVWEMKMSILGKKLHHAMITSGWSRFVRDNHLQVGNVCIFNLLHATDDLCRPLFHVTILRIMDGMEPGQQGVRKCVHCQVTETPQWRVGPGGLATLCNACGIRFIKGRLFPEYRPAKSPTFVPSLHSNSHNKVLTMKTNTNATTNDGDLPETLISTECTLTRSPESQQQS